MNSIDFNTYKIPVQNTSGLVIAYLVPVTFLGHDLGLVAEQLAKWRNANKECFLTEFLATKSGTLDWLIGTFKDPNNQMLFLVELEGRYVGHIGYKDLAEDTVLLDNVIRGEAGGEAKLFVDVGVTLIRWIFKNTRVKKINGIVFCDNVSAIMFNRQLGFQGWVKSYLVRENKNSVIEWKTAQEVGRNDEYRSVYNIFIER